MAVVSKIGTDTSTSATTESFNWSHTLVDGNKPRMVVVYLGGETGGVVGTTPYSAASVTYGGVAMTKAVGTKTTQTANGATSEIWYLSEGSLPMDGANTVQVNGQDGGTAVYLFGMCCEYQNVQGIGSTDGVFENATVVDDTIENTITAPPQYSYVVSTYTCGNLGTSWTVGQGQTQILDTAGGTTARMGVAELRNAAGTETSLSSTFVSGANRLTRVAAVLERYDASTPASQTHQMML